MGSNGEMKYEISQNAYNKLVLHSLRHKTAAVNGVLIGRVSPKDDGVVEISDYVPLFHSNLALLPPLEISLIMIEEHYVAQGLSIVGYFHANERFDDVELCGVAKNIDSILQVMGRVGFNFPIFLTLIHYISFLQISLFAFQCLLRQRLHLSPLSSLLLWPLLLDSLIPVSNSTAVDSIRWLRSIAVSFSRKPFLPQMFYMSLMTFSTIMYHYMQVFGAYSVLGFCFVLSQQVMALAVVSLGVAIATVTDLEFNLFGALVAVAWIIPSAINKILWSNLQQQANWTALALMWKTTPFTVFFLLALMPWLDPPGVLLFKWDLGNSSAILISALLGFLLQWSGALALGATSATSHVVLGQFKTCVILLGGYVIFGSDPGFISICGAVAALVGMSVYTWLNLPGKSIDHISSKQLPKQNITISKPKAEADDGGGETGVAVVSIDPIHSKTTTANIV